MSVIVKPKSTEEIILINRKIIELELEVDAKRGKYLVDARSLVGLFSLDFRDGIELIIYDNNNKDSAMEFIKFLHTFIR